MALDRVTTFFNETVNETLPRINEALKNASGNDLEVSFSDLETINSEKYIEGNPQPFLAISFASNGNIHQICISSEQAQKLTDFLGNTIEGEISEDHVTLLKNISEKAISDFSNSEFTFSNVQIIENIDNQNITENLQSQTLILKSGDDILELNLYHWENQGDIMEDTTLEVQQADFGELSSSNGTGSDNKIDMLLEVELDVTIELGRKKMTIQEVLQLGKGSVIELSKLAGEPVDIYVNQKQLAQGEVVVVDENFAIRITNLIDKSERLKSLGK